MGTDIHYFAERRGALGWELCYDPPAEGGRLERPFFRFYCGEDRCYELCAVLAGARNWGGGFEPICPSRGLPPDLSPEVRDLAAHTVTGEGCYHHHSWLSLRELLDFPWYERKRRHHGLVDAENYQRFRQQGRPLYHREFSVDGGRGCRATPVERGVLPGLCRGLPATVANPRGAGRGPHRVLVRQLGRPRTADPGAAPDRSNR